MRSVVQRVTRASVQVGDKTVGQIDHGALALIGVAVGDTSSDAEIIAKKIAWLRFFNDQDGAMNLSLGDVGGSVLAVSQFTLLADARRGLRPSFVEAASADFARSMFDRVVGLIRREGLRVETGAFGETMRVYLVNDGPVTILLDSRRTF